MEKILGLNITEMTGMSFDCSCGRKHFVDINNIVIGEDIAYKIIDIASDYKSGRIFFIADNNTYDVYGKRVEQLLKDNNFNLKSYIFNTSPHALVPDERALGRLLLEVEKDTSLMITVGSGSLNDLTRVLSSRLEIPYVIVGTAPSMDGYASTNSPMIVEGFKTTYEAVYPLAIIADINVMKEAPMIMLHAGFGDILAKYTALTDWDLSRRLNNEYYCETSVRLMKNAVKKCVDNVDGIVKRDSKAIRYMIEALILSGIAMGLVGNSRPASGGEHHFAHFWEMRALKEGRPHPLHGNSVGVGAVITSSIYQMMKDELPKGLEAPEPEKITHLLRRVGASDNPRTLGISREVFRESVLHAMEVRPRYTILRYASEKGRLEKYADILTRRFYE